MAGLARIKEKLVGRETLTEAYEVRAFRDEWEEARVSEPGIPEILHAETREFQAIKAMVKGHGEQVVLPDDCQFGDNDLCSVKS
jgi:hypothetical protein